MNKANEFASHSVNLPAGLTWRRLSINDLDEILLVHAAALAGTKPEVVKPEDGGFFTWLLEGNGSLTGVYSGSVLVAYGVLQYQLLEADNPAPEWIPPPDRKLFKLAGSVVLQDWRGKGLQRALIDQRVLLAGPDVELFSTASPFNPASWISLFDCGLSVRAVKRFYGGYVRFILVKEESRKCKTMFDDGECKDLACDDIAAQMDLLSDGWRGISRGANHGTIRYTNRGLSLDGSVRKMDQSK